MHGGSKNLQSLCDVFVASSIIEDCWKLETPHKATTNQYCTTLQYNYTTIQQYNTSNDNMVMPEQILALLGISQDGETTTIQQQQQPPYTQTLVTVVLTLLSYHVLFGNRHMRKRRKLAKELTVAKEQVSFLEEKLRGPSSSADPASAPNAKKEIRIFMEGAFDLMHFGHMNAFRLGRSLGTHLVVGVNSDESITRCKAAPLMNDEERLAMVKSCKFVDEVVPNTPYIMSKEYIDYIFETYNVDYIIHGDDPCIVDGK